MYVYFRMENKGGGNSAPPPRNQPRSFNTIIFPVYPFLDIPSNFSKCFPFLHIRERCVHRDIFIWFFEDDILEKFQLIRGTNFPS